MKKYSDDLYQLITNLTLSEKRYCFIYLNKHSAEEDNRYLQLFHILKSQTEYNSTSVMRLMSMAKRPGHYSVLKKQLYEQLLDAMHQYDLFSNPEQQLLRGINQCHLLLQKGLFNQCEKRIRALTKTAAEMNHYEAQLQLQSLKMMMKARNYYRHETEATLKNWMEDTKTILTELDITTNYRYVSSLAYKMQFGAGVRGKELAAKMKAIIDMPEFSDESLAVTLRSRLDFFQVNALYHFANLETEKASAYNERFLALLDENPLMLQLHADRYFSVLNNYLIDCLVLQKYDILESGLVKLRSLVKMPAFKRLANFEANVFRLGYLLEMNYMISTGRFADAYTKSPDINTGLLKFGDRIVKHNRITLQYLMAYVSFAVGDYDATLDHLWPIAQEKESAVAEDVQMAARMMQLLCHFEKGDTLLLDSRIKSLRRLLPKDETTEIQRAVLSFITSSLNKPLQQEKWLALEKKFGKLAIQKAAAQSLNLFNYLVWVDGHVQNKVFAKVWKV